jgi:MOSC domain-containing protein YiiM
VRETVRSGWYYRVLRPGAIEPGSALSLLERPQSHWTIARVMRAMLAREIDKDELAGIAAIAELSDGWKQSCRKRIAANQPEDWKKRFSGPA